MYLPFGKCLFVKTFLFAQLVLLAYLVRIAVLFFDAWNKNWARMHFSLEVINTLNEKANKFSKNELIS